MAVGCASRKKQNTKMVLWTLTTHGRSIAWWDEANNPYERLGDDRIQVKSSWCEFATTGGADTDIILRDALLTRNPCKFPTDTRESEGMSSSAPVYKPQLANYTDVIVCSVKGHRRLADWLAGGQRFLRFYSSGTVRNANEIFSHETEDVTEDFTQKARTGAHVMELVESEHPIPQTRKLQEYLLGGIQATSVVGVYSAFHDYAIYALGYTHPETIRLTYMLCALLDPFKNGRVSIDGVMFRDLAKYGKRLSAWKKSKENDDFHVNSTYNTLNPKRGHKLEQFIVDEFCKQAKDEGNVQKDAIRDSFQHRGRTVVDPHLTQPWYDEEGRIAVIGTVQMEVQLLATKIHVQAFKTRYQKEKD
ncbi:hypothetical protein FIBSPDRAFT_947970 [Athelia psychrophila]|uniref:RNA-dependent RNA polymerase n=1 Tax=Athelia psychrophila TaxID=1759441 RepID=A0A166RAD6_9AGAM|nr:hypothetical protein FIBSPDRAFT_947970 [Fibularhizoctonia sp. CBS 109695]